MSHVLSVYTAVYLAIVFCTVSIWGGRVPELKGDVLLLFTAQAMFALKLAIDDYCHFHERRGDHPVADLSLSLLMYLVLAASFASAAMKHGSLGAGLFAATFVVGIAWLALNWTGSEKTRTGEKVVSRRNRLTAVNGLMIALLGLAAYLGVSSTEFLGGTTWILSSTIVLVLVDFFVVAKTLDRLAKLK